MKGLRLKDLRDPYGILTVLADFVTVIVVLFLLSHGTFDVFSILAGVLIVGAFQVLSFVPGLRKYHKRKAGHLLTGAAAFLVVLSLISLLADICSHL